MLADHLENEGVTNLDRDSRFIWELLPPGKLWAGYLCQVDKDMDIWTNMME